MGYLQGYLLAAYLIVGLVAATQNQQPQTEQNGAWNRHKEYRYNLWTRTVAAIPDLKNQWVGVIGRGKLTIRPESNNALFGKLERVEYAQVHHELSGGWDEFIPENQLEFRPVQSSEKPFMVRLRNGAIHSIAVDKSMTNNDINQLKAAISQLQLDTRAQNVIKCKHNQFPEDGDNTQAVYKVMEPTVTGKCETLYDISPLPEYLIQSRPEWAPLPELQGKGMHYKIVKTKNYDNCEQRLGYHFGLSGANDWEANTNQMGDAVSKSAVSNVIVSGQLDRYTIQSSVTINKVVAKPGQNDQKNAQVVGSVNLTLESVQDVQDRPQVEVNQLIDVGNLIYTYDLPSDRTNKVRPMEDSSASSSSEEEQDNLMRRKQRQNLKKDGRSINEYDSSEQTRPRRSLTKNEKLNSEDAEDFGVKKQLKQMERQQKNRRQSSSSSSSSESDSDSSSSESNSVEGREQFHQPKPTLKKAPENPLSPFFIGYRGQSIQNAKNIDVLEVARKLSEEIGNDLQNPSEIPETNPLAKFNILSELIRTMDAHQIERLVEQLYVAEPEDESHEKTSFEEMKADSSEHKHKVHRQQWNVRNAAWATFRDAVTDAGTGPAITQTMKWIQTRKVRGENATQLIAAWPKTIREPTEEMQRAFYDFATSESVQQQGNVNATALMSLTRFLNMAQVNNQTARINYPVNTFGRLADRNNRIVAEVVIPHLAEKLSEAVRRRDSPNVLIYVRALGNLGHSDVLSVFEPYLEGKKVVTDFQRLAMVVALDQYRLNYPKTARSVLYKIYQNVGERHELRVAAVFQLILAQPDAAMLQRMAEQTNTETNPHVRAAVKSAIESAAELQTPEFAELAANAKAAVKLLTPEKLGMQYSRTNLRDYVVKELNAAYGQQVSWIVGEDALLPNGVFVRTEKNLGGFKHRSEYQAMVSSIDRLFTVLFRQFESSTKNEKSGNQKKDKSTLTLAHLFNIQVDEAEQLEGQLMASILNGKRFITFDNRTLEQLPRQVRKAAVTLKNGYKLDYTKLYNAEATTISFPLETGLPFVYNKYVPTLIKTSGKIRARSTPELVEGSNDEIQVPKTLKVNADIDVVYSTAIEANVGFFNPINHQRYEAGYTQKAQVYAPVRMTIDIDLRNHEIQSEIRPLEPTKRAQVLHLSSWPYTARQDILELRPIAESKNKKLIHTRPSRTIDFTFGDRITGFAFAVQGKHEKDAGQIADAWRTYSKLDAASVWSMIQTLSTPELFELDVNFEPERSTADSAKITLAYNSELMEGQNKQGEWKHPRATRNVNNKVNMAIPTWTTETNAKDRRRELLRTAAAGIANVDTQVIEVGIEFNGNGKKKAEYVATIATAKGLIGKDSRLLVVLDSKKAENAKTYQVCVHAQANYNIATEMNFNEALLHQSESDVEMYVTYGDKCDSSSAAHIVTKTKLEQTKALKQHLRDTPLAKLCMRQMGENNNQLPACQRMINKALNFDQAKIEFSLEKMPKSTRQTVYDIYTWVRQLVFPYVTEKINHQGKNDRVEINARLTPNMRRLNLTIDTPNTMIELEHLRVPQLPKIVMNPRLSIWERIQRKGINYLDTCVVDDNKLNTFDNRTIDLDLGKTWHLAMTTVLPRNFDKLDNSVRRRRQELIKNEDMSIFVRDSWFSGPRDVKNKPMTKDVNIIIGEHIEGKYDSIELRPTGESEKYRPRMLINGKEQFPSTDDVVIMRQHDSDEKPLITGYITPEKEIRLVIRKGSRQLRISYNGFVVKVQANGSFRKNVRGICGTFTGQQETDMKSPANCILRRDEDFIATWAVIGDAESKGPAEQRAREANKAKCVQPKVLLGNVISEREAGRKQTQRPVDNKHKKNNNKSSSSSSSSESRSNESTELKTSTDRMCEAERKVIYEQSEGMLCFSQRTVPACPKGCKAVNTVERRIDAHCRDEEETAAKLYRDQIKKGQTPNMSKHETNGKVMYQLPTKCVRA